MRVQAPKGCIYYLLPSKCNSLTRNYYPKRRIGATESSCATPASVASTPFGATLDWTGNWLWRQFASGAGRSPPGGARRLQDGGPACVCWAPSVATEIAHHKHAGSAFAVSREPHARPIWPPMAVVLRARRESQCGRVASELWPARSRFYELVSLFLWHRAGL